MRTVNVLLLVLLLGGGLWAWLSTKPARPPVPEEDAPLPASAAESAPLRPEPVTGTLVLRVRTADGSPLPPDTEAGYLRFGDRRLRRAAKDGSFPFADAPVGTVDAVAQAEGWTSEIVPVRVVPGVPAETWIVLTPR